MNKIITLSEFIYQRQKDFFYATGELSGLLRDIGLASKIISREVNRAGLSGVTGHVGRSNASGETQQKSRSSKSTDTEIVSHKLARHEPNWKVTDNDDSIGATNAHDTWCNMPWIKLGVGDRKAGFSGSTNIRDCCA